MPFLEVITRPGNVLLPSSSWYDLWKISDYLAVHGYEYSVPTPDTIGAVFVSGTTSVAGGHTFYTGAGNPHGQGDPLYSSICPVGTDRVLGSWYQDYSIPNDDYEQMEVYNHSTGATGSVNSWTDFTGWTDLPAGRRLVPLSSTTAVMLWTNGPMYGNIVTISGQTVTSVSDDGGGSGQGGEVILSDASDEIYAGQWDYEPLTSTSFLLAWNGDDTPGFGGNTYLKLMVVTVSGGNFSLGTPTTVLNGYYGRVYLTMWSSTEGMLLGYNDNDQSNGPVEAWKVTVAGSSVSVGAKNTISYDRPVAMGLFSTSTPSVLAAFTPSGTAPSMLFHEIDDGFNILDSYAANGTGSYQFNTLMNVARKGIANMADANAIYIGSWYNAPAARFESFHYAFVGTGTTSPSMATGSGYLAISMSQGAEIDTGSLWATVFNASEQRLELKQYDGINLALTATALLGPSTESEVLNRNGRIAYVYAATDEQAWVYGRMESPANLTGTVHLVETVSGPTGSYSDFGLAWNAGDICGALLVSPDQTGADDRVFNLVRNQTGSVPEYWSGLNTPVKVADLPFPTGVLVRHGAIHKSRSGLIGIGSDRGAEAANRVVVYANNQFNDVTYDLPSGTISVLRFF